MTILRNALIFCLIAGSMPAAWAQAYISGHGGMAMLEDATVAARSSTTDPITGVTTTTNLVYDMDFGRSAVAAAALGYVMNNARVEIEGSMQKNEVDGLGISGLASAPATFTYTGRVKSKGLMVNGYYDLPTGTRFRPYLTLGAGITRVDVLIESADVPELNVDSAETSATYLAGVGIGIDITSRSTLDLRYRYITADNTEFQNTNMNHESHNFMAGIRFRF